MKPEDFIEKWATSMRVMLIGISPQESTAKKRVAAEREFVEDAKSAICWAREHGERLERDKWTSVFGRMLGDVCACKAPTCAEEVDPCLKSHTFGGLVCGKRKGG